MEIETKSFNALFNATEYNSSNAHLVSGAGETTSKILGEEEGREEEEGMKSSIEGSESKEEARQAKLREKQFSFSSFIYYNALFAWWVLCATWDNE